jgi:hypothetical protein
VASPSFYRNSHIFENIAYYENDCNQNPTPAGVGFTRKRRCSSHRATSLKSRAEKVGVLRNPVVDEAAQ